MEPMGKTRACFGTRRFANERVGTHCRSVGKVFRDRPVREDRCEGEGNPREGSSAWSAPAIAALYARHPAG